MVKIDTSEWKFFALSELGFENFHEEHLNK
ncbi:Uncharacterised protein [Streptococcus gallolyticus]|uniref:Uncharacterized protein n=1 Tax=Streptococcus gallolyticus TaxID=315405 RepID=A0AA94S939_9STRE|nr:Uncharacterised protein [Streptococcus gallolyticus]